MQEGRKARDQEKEAVGVEAGEARRRTPRNPAPETRTEQIVTEAS